MNENLQEQAYWLLLTFESGLPTRIINDILVAWCKQLGRTLQEFFAASSQEWSDTCHLNAAMIGKLERAREKLVGQAFLVEQLSHDHIHLLTVLDAAYPKLLKSSLNRNQIPPVLCYAGDLDILKRQTIAIIGSRNAGETSLAFTQAVAQYLAEHGANVISGNARGVDRAAYSQALAGNETLIERGGHPLPWPTENIANILSPLLQESAELQHKQSELPARSEQLSLFATSNE